MLGEADLGLAVRPVLVAHQAEDGQELRLRELVLREATAVRGQDGPTDRQRGPRKRDESHFGHGTTLLLVPAVQETGRMSTKPHCF